MRQGTADSASLSVTAIRPDDAAGEERLLPLLSRFRPTADTSVVEFKTVKPCFATQKSHVDQVAADTGSWEQATAFPLETSPHVAAYVRNERLEFTIPYQWNGTARSYTPDFLVRLVHGSTLVLEVKGQEREQDRDKHEAARRWRDAVNNWGRLGRWRFEICRDPQALGAKIAEWLRKPA